MFNRKYLIYKLKSNSYESNMYFSFIKYILKSTLIYSIFLKSKKSKCTNPIGVDYIYIYIYGHFHARMSQSLKIHIRA